MRAEFVSTLLQLAERDPRIVLLTGDLGYTVLEPFAERLPERFFNVGVAEQNMIGLATGLAEGGLRPYAYSIATFASLRPYEFLRNGPALHRLPVRLVGVGGGFDYGHNGISHYALEDVGLMRMQPNVTVAVPADGPQARAAVNALADLDEAAYLRLGKDSEPVPGLDGRFELGRAELIGEGSDVALVAMGPLAREAVAAAERLADAGVSTTVAVVSSFNPSPDEDLADLLSAVPLAVTAEAHYVVGGLGSYVSELVAEQGLACRVLRCGPSTMPSGATGSRAYLYDIHGLSAQAIAHRAATALQLSNS